MSIFREYIGVKPYPPTLTDFSEIINTKIPEFHFILGFATELYENRRGTGHFKRTWIVDYFSAENIKKLKDHHKNVKVLISIGGVGTEYPFNPAEKEVWPVNATASLKKIINLYGGSIDGIDINYEDITSSDIDFAHCIGQVISALKEQGLIKVVSIAPSEKVERHYKELYKKHKNDIKWVNYKFYNQTVPSVDKFKELYDKLSKDYHAAKLLAGFSTDPDVKGVTLEVFLGGCIDLLYTKSLPGIFVWNAHDSAVPRPNEKRFSAVPRPNEKRYWVEDIAQKLLTMPPH